MLFIRWTSQPRSVGAAAGDHGRPAGPFHSRGETLRRNAEPVHGRRHHGRVRRTNHVGGSRLPCLSGGLGHSGGSEAPRGGGPRSRRSLRIFTAEEPSIRSNSTGSSRHLEGNTTVVLLANFRFHRLP